MNEYIVIAFTENHIGVLNRITSAYLRRKINIESLKVSESSVKGVSMFVISSYTTECIINKLVKQLRNIIDVIEVQFYTPDQLIAQDDPSYQLIESLRRKILDEGLQAEFTTSGSVVFNREAIEQILLRKIDQE